jgi:ABC-type antimicrobial peptide transport system permease subunit
LLGGAVGTAIATAILTWRTFSLTTEGLSINVHSEWRVVAIGLAISGALGVLAGLVPAWQASRRKIVECFRAV